ncbi:MAG: hypothetical protein RBU30_13880 [Polyangia bacterium]|nr:hypothetical protein [Polyangia bacterium]
MSGWRSEGLGEADLQIWAIGWAGQGFYASQFAQGAVSPLLADSSSGPDGVFAAWGASVDDLFLLDRDGLVRYQANLISMDLGESRNRRALNDWVTALVGP